MGLIRVFSGTWQQAAATITTQLEDLDATKRLPACGRIHWMRIELPDGDAPVGAWDLRWSLYEEWSSPFPTDERVISQGQWTPIGGAYVAGDWVQWTIIAPTAGLPAWGINPSRLYLLTTPNGADFNTTQTVNLDIAIEDMEGG
jgi:hypothetical protein